MKRAIFLCLLSVIFFQTIQAQTNNDKIEEAIQLMESGNIGESIILLNEVLKEEPDSYVAGYELGYAYYLKKDYKEAIKIMKKLEKHKDVNHLLYGMIGNAYDELGESKKALKTYDDALKKFPEKGILYLNKGVTLMRQEDYNGALAIFEKGIEADPIFPSNYYWAAKMFNLDTEEKNWGMIYGEIFMNLERNSRRTQEISKLLYDTYKNNITIVNDTSVALSFTKKEQTIYLDKKKSGDAAYLLKALSQAYNSSVYDSVMKEAVLPAPKEIDLTSLNTIRNKFVTIYTEKYGESDPNVLFTFQKEIQALGLMNAYNHWILMQGDLDAFDEWHAENQQEWDRFVNWFTANPIQITHDNKFVRTANP